MNMDDGGGGGGGDAGLQHSQASSHFPLEPISGATLFGIEVARRQKLRRKGLFRTGCKEVDDYILRGGFERGAVVGVSAEDVDMGLLLGLQTVAHSLVFGTGASELQRAAIVTTLATPAILPLLRDVIRIQVQSKLGQGNPEVNTQVRQCLERISISRVFDLEGLWEVLNELDTLHTEQDARVTSEDQLPNLDMEPPQSSQVFEPPTPVTKLPPLRRIRTEVLDSEDEGGLSSSPSTTSSPFLRASPPESRGQAAPQPLPHNDFEDKQQRVPDIILITHFSTLLTALFTHRDKPSAHTSLQLLASHLRYLSRSAGPLIMLFNSTTSPSANPAETPKPGSGSSRKAAAAQKPIDGTLRSIFNPAPPTHTAYGAASLGLSRRNKPAFGLTFAQFLDLHLLCTRVPRSRADSEAFFAPTLAQERKGRVRFVWVVEVLLDDVGVDEESLRPGPKRKGSRDREQRWGAVEVNGNGLAVDDAFIAQEARPWNTAPVRLAAGFGGPKV